MDAAWIFCMLYYLSWRCRENFNEFSFFFPRLSMIQEKLIGIYFVRKFQALAAAFAILYYKNLNELWIKFHPLSYLIRALKNFDTVINYSLHGFSNLNLESTHIENLSVSRWKYDFLNLLPQKNTSFRRKIQKGNVGNWCSSFETPSDYKNF